MLLALLKHLGRWTGKISMRVFVLLPHLVALPHPMIVWKQRLAYCEPPTRRVKSLLLMADLHKKCKSLFRSVCYFLHRCHSVEQRTGKHHKENHTAKTEECCLRHGLFVPLACEQKCTECQNGRHPNAYVNSVQTVDFFFPTEVKKYAQGQAGASREQRGGLQDLLWGHIPLSHSVTVL